MISVVVPVFNEQESLETLHGEIVAVAQEANLDVEIVFIEDGSTDASWEVITQLAAAHPQTQGIRFRRNFGKAAALAAGFRASRGDIIITMDGDLQDDPREIPRFLEALEHGPDLSRPKHPIGKLDLVSGWKRTRHDPWHKVGPSRVFNRLVGALTGVHLHDHNCGMKAYRAEVVREIRLYGEFHRFVPVLAAARGFRVGEIPINHRARKFGSSKYGLRRFIKGFLDLLTVKFLTGFGQSPQHLLGSLGLLAFLVGSLVMVFLAVDWMDAHWLLIWHEGDDFTPLHQRPLLTYGVASLLVGAQMMSMGLLAELMTAYYRSDQDRYSIAETIQPTQQGLGNLDTAGSPTSKEAKAPSQPVTTHESGSSVEQHTPTSQA